MSGEKWFIQYSQTKKKITKDPALFAIYDNSFST